MAAQVTRAIKLNYIVSVGEGETQTNPDEHSESMWATQEEVRGQDVTDEMRAVIWEPWSAVSIRFGWT
ncbi:hypothetical protein G6O67_007913 [Ophiocordyceps sinensis]|uniref:Uncharacterized protein n=2 Tax=Ophiocordyceps sinensis TaxID=72228 RepID=A0A8H4LS97_9HYPO|nr:hypothetical protein OCS_04614 [Ophiocordyceps sinensis CO18]KAF4504463.1 hypothetical protein G6O67_007913 [Ophiocordyceps sinensis]